MIANVFLLVFALGFLGCVLATPLVSRVAGWAGAIDRPDRFRRIHIGAVPRMGGLALACGLGCGLTPIFLGGYLNDWPAFPEWFARQWAVFAAALVVLCVGSIDDASGVRPRVKLIGQTIAVLILIAGGIRIQGITFMGVHLPLSYPITVSCLGRALEFDLPSTVVTLFWFLGCMNVWNLIDGMDGLASGVGLLVSATLMLVAIHQENFGSATLAAALAGGLAGFLLYNWHPACIFLGDSGSLLIGLLIGVIGAQDSLKGTTAVSILFPLLAMGLPISDTAMAIFRRWVRNLPLSSADRRHLHHLLMGLGLGPRRAALVLYFFTAGMCGVVLIGVAWNNDVLALILGVSGCLAFLVILTSRRDELTSLWGDLQARRLRKVQERFAARVTWEAIQKIELCEDPDAIWQQLLEVSQAFDADTLLMECQRDRQIKSRFASERIEAIEGLAGPTATFRLPSGQDLLLTVSLHQSTEATLAPDIAFRALQRLSLAIAQRFERLVEPDKDPWPSWPRSTDSTDPTMANVWNPSDRNRKPPIAARDMWNGDD